MRGQLAQVASASTLLYVTCDDIPPVKSIYRCGLSKYILVIRSSVDKLILVGTIEVSPGHVQMAGGVTRQ